MDELLSLATGLCCWTVVLGALPGYVYLTKYRPAKMVRKQVNEQLVTHRDTLRRKRAQSIYRDAYGQEVDRKWRKDIDYFLDNVVSNELEGFLREALQRIRPSLILMIDETVRRETDTLLSIVGDPEEFSATEFEKYCAELLVTAGWEVEWTGEGTDFGVDIIAERGSNRVVIQCKKYSKPVGVTAVREAAAGREHFDAGFACVVSTGTYTKQAEQLARTNRVELVHYSDLPRLNDILFEPHGR